MFWDLNDVSLLLRVHLQLDLLGLSILGHLLVLSIHCLKLLGNLDNLFHVILVGLELEYELVYLLRVVLLVLEQTFSWQLFVVDVFNWFKRHFGLFANLWVLDGH